MQVNALRRDLTLAFDALYDLKALNLKDGIESQRYAKLVDVIGKKTKSLNFKPFFEKISTQNKIVLKGLSERAMDIDPNNRLSDVVKEYHIEMKIAKVSIPKLLGFLVDIERSGQYLRIQNLKITGIYGNKLFFDAEILVRGYKTSK
jgi:hypothetical protein